MHNSVNILKPTKLYTLNGRLYNIETYTSKFYPKKKKNRKKMNKIKKI